MTSSQSKSRWQFSAFFLAVGRRAILAWPSARSRSFRPSDEVFKTVDALFTAMTAPR